MLAFIRVDFGLNNLALSMTALSAFKFLLPRVAACGRNINTTSCASWCIVLGGIEAVVKPVPEVLSVLHAVLLCLLLLRPPKPIYASALEGVTF